MTVRRNGPIAGSEHGGGLALGAIRSTRREGFTVASESTARETTGAWPTVEEGVHLIHEDPHPPSSSPSIPRCADPSRARVLILRDQTIDPTVCIRRRHKQSHFSSSGCKSANGTVCMNTATVSEEGQ